MIYAQAALRINDVVLCIKGFEDYYIKGKKYIVEEHRGVPTVRNEKGCRSFEEDARFELVRK